MPAQAKWYEIKSQSGTRAEIYIFGVVVDYKWDEDDVTAKEFIDAVKGLGDIDLHINSPGGSVPAGNAIYNALRRHKGDVAVYVDGMAASIASVIAMAGDRVVMPENAMLMIHDPWTIAMGNAAEMRQAAEVLDKFKSGLVAAYRDKTGMAQADIERMMVDETWITAAEAVEMGFADELEEPIRASARFDLSRYNNVPRALKQPARATGSTHNERKELMDLKALKEKHPDLVAQVEAAAREGMIAKADHDTALTEARTEAGDEGRKSVLDLHSALYGDEAGEAFQAVVDSGVTAEQAKSLGVSLVPQNSDDEESRKAILAGITAAAPEGVQAGKPESGEETERQAAVSAIASGGSR